jgi:hypothetical protein
LKNLPVRFFLTYFDLNQSSNFVLTVYNEGIRAHVGNGDAKGARGGFAIGGYDATKSGTI